MKVYLKITCILKFKISSASRGSARRTTQIQCENFMILSSSKPKSILMFGEHYLLKVINFSRFLCLTFSVHLRGLKLNGQKPAFQLFYHNPIHPPKLGRNTTPTFRQETHLGMWMCLKLQSQGNFEQGKVNSPKFL